MTVLFFDKRSKFVHYRPRTLVLNNLEFDHADIFDDLAAIQRQFHHLIRTVPSTGRIFAPKQDKPLEQVLEQGCWSELEFTGEDGQWKAIKLQKMVVSLMYILRVKTLGKLIGT